MSVTVSRLYDDDAAVRRTVGELEAVGLRRDEMVVTSRDEMVVTSNAVNLYAGGRTSGATRTAPDRGEWRPDGMVEQAVGARAFVDIGFAIAGAAVLLIALGLLVIPGLGAIVAGAIGGWLIQRAVSDDAQGYAEGVRRGGTLVAVRVPEADPARYEAILDRSAVNITDRASASRKVGWNGFSEKAAPSTAEQGRKEREG